MEDITTVSISRTLKARIDRLGKHGENWDDILERLIFKEKR